MAVALAESVSDLCHRLLVALLPDRERSSRSGGLKKLS